MYGTAIDYVYEVNKHGSTDQSIKAEMVGSLAGAGASIGADRISISIPNYQGVSKIISSTIVGDKFSDWAKGKYETHIKDKERSDK